MDFDGLKTLTRQVDLGLVPIPILYDSQSNYSTVFSRVFSFVIVVGFTIYVIVVELEPFFYKKSFTVSSREEALSDFNLLGIHQGFYSFIDVNMTHLSEMNVDNSIAELNTVIEYGMRCDNIIYDHYQEWSFFNCRSDCSEGVNTIFLNESLLLYPTVEEYNENYRSILEIYNNPCSMFDTSNRLEPVIGTLHLYLIPLSHGALIELRFTYFSADITDVLEGYVKRRKSDRYVQVGIGQLEVTTIFQKVSINHYSQWFAEDIVRTETVFRKISANAASYETRSSLYGASFDWSSIQFVLEISDMETIVDVRPQTLTDVIARIGGLSSVLAVLGLIGRAYNARSFQQSIEGKGKLEYSRILHSCEYTERLEEAEQASLMKRSPEESQRSEVEMSSMKKDVVSQDALDELKLCVYRHIDRKDSLKLGKEDLENIRRTSAEIIAFADVALEKLSESRASTDNQK